MSETNEKDSPPKPVLDKAVKEEEDKAGEDVREKALSQYTGGNFYPYKDLVNITDSYLNRTKCEDVDQLNDLGLDKIIDKLQTSLETGIKESTVEARIEAYGSNKPPETSIKGCIMLFIEALNDLTLIILMVAAVVSIIINFITEEHKYLGSYSFNSSLDRRIRNSCSRVPFSRSTGCPGCSKRETVCRPQQNC